MKPEITPSPLDQKAGSAAFEAERRQQLLVPLGAAGTQHVEILLREAGLGLLIGRVQRVHQAIAERIGVDVERHMDEVRDIGPIGRVAGAVRQVDAVAQRLALGRQPDLARSAPASARPRAARRAGGARYSCIAIWRTTVFSMSSTLPASRTLRSSGSVSRFSSAWKVSISPNTEAVSARVSGVSHSSWPCGAASTWCTPWPSSCARVITSRVRP